jgi:hypothetical protein
VEAPEASGRPVLGEVSHQRGQKLGEGVGIGIRQRGKGGAIGGGGIGGGGLGGGIGGEGVGGCRRGCPSGGRLPPAGATTSLAVATLPLREPPLGSVEGDGVEDIEGRFPNYTTMQGHLKINIDLSSALCPPQLHKIK